MWFGPTKNLWDGMHTNATNTTRSDVFDTFAEWISTCCALVLHALPTSYNTWPLLLPDLQHPPRVTMRLPLPSVLSTPSPPPPSGPYSVSLLDTRLLHAPFLRARIFYPTSSPTSSTPRAAWFPPAQSFPDENVSSILSFSNIPFSSLLSPLLTPLSRLSLPCAFKTAPLPGRYPLALFSHGLGGSRHAYSTLCLDLSSHGVVVVAVEHTDGSAAGTWVRDRWVGYERGVGGGFRARQLEERVGDLRAAEEAMRSGGWEADMEFGEILEDGVWMVGHSWGGATGVEVASRWGDRVKGVVAVDAWIEGMGDVEDVDVDCGVMWVDLGDEMRGSRRKREKLGGSGWREGVVVQNGTHGMASDFGILLPDMVGRGTGLGGETGKMVMSRITEAVVSGVMGQWDAYWRRVQTGEVQGVHVATGGRRRT